jgi:hypothetical protein
MENYRIKKVIRDGGTYYYPQKKVLFWWTNIDDFGVRGDGYFDTLEEAKYHLKKLLLTDLKTVVEYIYNLD